MVFYITLLLAALLCTLVAGFLLAFTVVVMPGIKTLGNAQYLKAFQVMDGVIQNKQPLFMAVWVGSVASLVFALVMAIGRLKGFDLSLLLFAAAIYIAGVQVPTAVVHLPLNNRVQRLNIGALNATELSAERLAFERRWNLSNKVRTVLSGVVSAVLLLLLLRLNGLG